MPSVGVIGAGTMGAGIAQVAAASGWTVQLMDVNAEIARKALANIGRSLEKLVEKGKLGPTTRDAALRNLHAAESAAALAECELIVEAVVEDLDAKVAILSDAAAAARPDAIIASNTSSLSITRLGRGIARRGAGGPAATGGASNTGGAAAGDAAATAAASAQRADGCDKPAAADAAAESHALDERERAVARRVVGMHFFNPVPLMPLVEIIAGADSDAGVVERTAEIARAWGKTPVRAKDTPGFIVNRIARGYYLESLRMLGEGVAGVDEIDRTLRSLGGFRMGPFELMDLIGIDVNFAVTCSVWEQMGRPARLAPHAIQERLVSQKLLGRKSKQGFYSYQGEHPVPAVVVERRSYDVPPKLYECVRRLADAGAAERGSSTEQYVFARVLAAIINEAGIALDDGVASPADIDTAMKLGTNYPRGPIEWAEQIGRHTAAGLLRELNATVGDGRFGPARWLGG